MIAANEVAETAPAHVRTNRVYWIFHVVLFLAFAVGILGFAIEGPSGSWNQTIQTGLGQFGFSSDRFGTTIYYGWDQSTVGFGLYAVAAFASAAALFGFALLLGSRWIYDF
jgi:hypothetical protein